jgi:hypothetical protein
MINVNLIDPKTKSSLHHERVWAETPRIEGDEVFLIGMDSNQAHGTFTNASRSTAGTTTITTPIASGSLLITDLVLNTEKQTGGQVDVIFTDDTQTITVFRAYCADAPANLVLDAAGRFQGWKEARLDLVVTGATDCSVTLGYVKLPTGLPYEEWDSLR